MRPDPDPGAHWHLPNAGKTSGVKSIDPQPASAVAQEEITYPIAQYFSPHETEEYKA